MKPQVPFPVMLMPPLVVSSNNMTTGGELYGEGKATVCVPDEQAEDPASWLGAPWLKVTGV